MTADGSLPLQNENNLSSGALAKEDDPNALNELNEPNALNAPGSLLYALCPMPYALCDYDEPVD